MLKLDYLVNRFMQIMDSYRDIITVTLIRKESGLYELQLFGMPALLDMELLKTEVVEWEEVETDFDSRGRPRDIETIRHSYPICIPVTDKEKYHLKVELNPQHCARKLIEIDCAIKRFVDKHN